MIKLFKEKLGKRKKQINNYEKIQERKKHKMFAEKIPFFRFSGNYLEVVRSDVVTIIFRNVVLREKSKGLRKIGKRFGKRLGQKER